MARALEKEDSVYDFLYIDARRLAHFLSQFSQYGHLTALTRSVSETSTSSGGVNLHVAKVDSGSSGQTGQTKQFDAQWIAPLTFLDEANKRGMIIRGVDAARIGQLVLVSGSLALFDLSAFKALWNSPVAMKLIMKALSPPSPEASPVGNRQERRRQERNEAPPNANEVAFDLLKTMPHKILATVRHHEESVWCILSEDGMTIPASDILLKHGVSVAGSWNVIGVLDAMPVSDSGSAQDKAAQEAAGLSLGSMGMFIASLGPAIRGMLGRPSDAYGMTPLLIFREVSGS